MGEVTLTIADQPHRIACRDGEEGTVQLLGAMLERHAPAALRASRGRSGERTLLFIALMLADELAERERSPDAGVSPAILGQIAERLESVAASLEEGVQSA